MDISCVLAALLLMFPYENHDSTWVHVHENVYWLSENSSSHYTVILALKGSITLKRLCQLKCKISIICNLLTRTDCAHWLFQFSFRLSLWFVMILTQLYVCMVLTVPTYLHPPPLVQHQAKACAEPGSVWRVLSLPYSWAFSSTSGNNLPE